MSKIKYLDHNLSAKSLEKIDQANQIIDEFQAAGDVLSLRQLYYQHVARDLFENTERNYQNLINLITKGREAGLVSWTAIEDRERHCRQHHSNEDLGSAVSGLQYAISFDRWKRQENYVECWVEKKALEPVIARTCDEWDVPYMACKGYMSASEIWRAGVRFAKASNIGKHCVLLHLGDHDPSGLDMTRDNHIRAELFGACDVHVHRLALNMNQIEEHAPPPNPTKLTDSRAQDYVDEFGLECWELDALNPATIRGIIEDAIHSYMDIEAWNQTAEDEENSYQREILRSLEQNWDDVEQFLADL